MRQVFYAELALPKTLQDKAYLLSGEYAWAASDAMNVVQWLSERGIAVFGVELWHDKLGCASWVATSHYSCEDAIVCAGKAKRFIDEFQHYESQSSNLFNLTVDTKAPTSHINFPQEHNP